VRGGAAAGSRRFSAPALASSLLHTGAVLALAALHSAHRLPSPAREQGVEIVWQNSPEDSAPGEADAPGEDDRAPSASAEAESQPPPPEPALAEALPPKPETEPPPADPPPTRPSGAASAEEPPEP